MENGDDDGKTLSVASSSPGRELEELGYFFVEEPSRPCTRADRKDAKAEKEQTDWNK
jgi:hypothetical protein